MAEGDTIVVRSGHQVLGPAQILTGAATQTRTDYVGDEDPAVDYLADLHPGDQWTQTGGDLQPPFPLWVRNFDNDGWQVAGLVYVEDGVIRASVVISAPGDLRVIELATYDALGVELVTARLDEATFALSHLASGAEITMSADGDISVGGGNGRTITLNIFGAGTFSLSAADGIWLNNSLVRIQGIPTEVPVEAHGLWTVGGWLRKGGFVPPEIPAVPTEQDIVDALVAIGFVTQAP